MRRAAAATWAGGPTGEVVERTVRVGALLLVMTAGLALLLTRRMAPSAIVLFGSALLGVQKPRSRQHSIYWEVASFCYLVFFFADLFFLSASLASALVHLFIFITVNKIFNLRTASDYYQLYLLTFLTVLAASSLSVEIEMFYLIVFYILMLVWNIVSLTMFQEWQKDREAKVFPFSLLDPRYCALVLASTVVAFAIALGIFYLLPRMQLGYFSSLNPDKVQHVSGFSEKVQLGDIAAVQENNDVAMRVRVSGFQGMDMPRLYWRGVAFDHYDGRSWSTVNSRVRFLFQDSSSTFYAYYYRGSPDQLVKQEIYMQPMDTRVIFGADRITMIHGSFSQVTRDGNESFYASLHPESYEVYSKISVPTLEVLRHANPLVPEIIRRYYLQLPEMDPRIGELSRQITAGKTSAIDQVVAVRDYLRDHYKYSTTRLPLSTRDPISEFLFSQREGHCEYFATSMVLLLRSAGIPARLVNGFVQGEYNSIGDFYLVRNSDAHSWAEVFIGGDWVTFDPSPRPLLFGSRSDQSLLNYRKILDSISFFWDRYILIFSAEDQLNTLAGLRDRFHGASRVAKGQYRSLPGSISRLVAASWKSFRLQLLLALVLLLASLIALRLYRRSRGRAKMLSTPILFYREMLRILERKGFTRVAQSTPAEFAGEVVDQLQPTDRGSVLLLTELFYRSRYGDYRLTADDRHAVQDSLATLAGKNRR